MKLIVAFRSLRARLKIQLDHPFVMSSRLCERTHTHTDKYAILIAFHGNSGFVNAPQCYVIRTLHLLLKSRVCLKYPAIYKEDSLLSTEYITKSQKS